MAPVIRRGAPRARVFVFGVELTDDVHSVRVTLSDDRQPGTAQITLANIGRDEAGHALVDPRYVVGPADVAAMYSDVTPQDLPATAPRDATSISDITTAQQEQVDARNAVDRATFNVQREVESRIDRAVRDPVKRAILREKVKYHQVVRQPDPRVSATVTAPSEVLAFQGAAYTYPFDIGDCIFSSSDAVRIFLKDPFSNRWYFAFSGYVSTWSESVDVQLKSTVTLTCEDVLRTFRYARFTNNPGFFDEAAAVTSKDAAVRNFMNKEAFSGFTLPEMLHALTFGLTQVGTNVISRVSTAPQVKVVDGVTAALSRRGVRGPASTEAPVDGVGAFNLKDSVTFIFGDAPSVSQLSEYVPAPVPVNDLALYQAYVDHEVHISDWWSMRSVEAQRDNVFPTDAAEQPTSIEQVITAVGCNPQLYPVEGRLVMLTPGVLAASTDLIMKDVGQSVELYSTFSTRLSLIYDILKRVEFSFFASPKGDLIVEMPLCDFMPSDWGTRPVPRSALSALFTDAGRNLAPDAPRFPTTYGPFGPAQEVSAADCLSYERQFNDERVRTEVVCEWHPLKAYDVGGTQRTAGHPAEFVRAVALIPAFGVRSEQVEPLGYVSSPEAARALGALRLNQLNANARTLNVGVLPHPARMWPNRPLRFERRSVVATTRQVNLTFVVRSQFEHSFTLNYVRGTKGQKDAQGNFVYTTIGGSAAKVWDYAKFLAPQNLFPNPTPAAPSSVDVRGTKS